MTSGGNNFNCFAENQLTNLKSARDAGDFSEAAGEREMAPKCGSLPRDAGDLLGLLYRPYSLDADYETNTSKTTLTSTASLQDCNPLGC